MANLNFQDILLSGLLSGGLAHPYGHVQAGNEQGMPVTIDWRNRAEDWNPGSRDNASKTQVYGGGFAMQDLLGQASQSPNMRMANGLYKLGYMSGKTLPMGMEGDVTAMENLSGNKYTKHLLGASAAMDIYKAYNPNDRWDVQFITPNGAPGLQFNYKW